MSQSLEERFWSKVDKDGPTMSHMDSNCWVWTAYKNPGGYGRLRVDGKKQLAHRVSLSLVLGCMPELHVLHACDNPACVRPGHLREGTNLENIQESFERGRVAMRGEQVGNSKLTESKVRQIRERHANGETCTSLSNRYGISRREVLRVARKTVWAHVN